ncbi:MAG: hypothetical protein JWN73_836 [Betaproteobacteria bacterium]|nr:hypothetical protein [Betaproteobacteria bacterium]
MPSFRPPFAVSLRCLLLFLCLLLPACSPKMDWREHHFDDGGFTMLFPQKPGQAERSLSTPMGAVTMKMYSVRIDETVLGAGFADFAAPLDAHALDVMRDALVKGLGGTMVSEKPVKSAGPDGIAGREVLITGALGHGEKAAPGEMRVRLYARDKRYYQVLLVGRKGMFGAEDADMFLNSFKPY